MFAPLGLLPIGEGAVEVLAKQLTKLNNIGNWNWQNISTGHYEHCLVRNPEFVYMIDIYYISIPTKKELVLRQQLVYLRKV